MRINTLNHYTISTQSQIIKQAFTFNPPQDIETPTSTKGLWFDPTPGTFSVLLSKADGQAQAGLQSSPTIISDSKIHLDDQVSCVSITCPPGMILEDIDPGNIHKVEVDICLTKGIVSAVNPDPAPCLTYIFTNPNPSNPVPINVDACLVKDKHHYPRRLDENRDRAYHKLLLRRCLAPSYQIWPDVLTIKEAAAYSRVNECTVSVWIKDGGLKASPGTKPRIRKVNLNAYLESN